VASSGGFLLSVRFIRILIIGEFWYRRILFGDFLIAPSLLFSCRHSFVITSYLGNRKFSPSRPCMFQQQQQSAETPAASNNNHMTTSSGHGSHFGTADNSTVQSVSDASLRHQSHHSHHHQQQQQPHRHQSASPTNADGHQGQQQPAQQQHHRHHRHHHAHHGHHFQNQHLPTQQQLPTNQAVTFHHQQQQSLPDATPSQNHHHSKQSQQQSSYHAPSHSTSSFSAVNRGGLQLFNHVERSHLSAPSLAMDRKDAGADGVTPSALNSNNSRPSSTHQQQQYQPVKNVLMSVPASSSDSYSDRSNNYMNSGYSTAEQMSSIVPSSFMLPSSGNGWMTTITPNGNIVRSRALF
jgi:hypothetical protein